MRTGRLVASLLLSLGLPACSDDATDATDTSDSGSGSSGPSATSMLPTTATTADTSTSDPAGTGSSGSSTGTPADGTSTGTSTGTEESSTGPADSSSTGAAETSSSEGSESGSGSTDTGPAPAEPWGDCINLPPADCLPGDVCINDDATAPAFGVCATPDCVTEADCPAAPDTGTAPVACTDVTGDMLTECVLDCSAGQACPDGMSCFGDMACTHELVLFACADATIGGPLPVTSAGSTVGTGNDFTPNCSGGGNSEDVALQWTAPSTGTWVLHTQGSAIDTVLHVYDGCGGPLLACNDDGPVAVDCGGYPCSQITMDLVAGHTILVVVDGWNVTGDYALTIDLQGDFGNCCEYQEDFGCEVPAVEACVCALDNFCCKVVWDDICAQSAENDCGAYCP